MLSADTECLDVIGRRILSQQTSPGSHQCDSLLNIISWQNEQLRPDVKKLLLHYSVNSLTALFVICTSNSHISVPIAITNR